MLYLNAVMKDNLDRKENYIYICMYIFITKWHKMEATTLSIVVLTKCNISRSHTQTLITHQK